MRNILKDDSTDFLFECILKLETVEDCYAFFEDLCTIPEIKAMSQRASVARLLYDKTVYNEIVAKTGASTATISRVKRSLAYGAGGYDIVFNKE